MRISDWSSDVCSSDLDHVTTGPWMRNTLKADKAEDRDHALSDIYRVMRPGEPPTRETAEALFDGLFFDPERYDLSAVGRVKLNMRLDLDAEDTVTTLRREDIIAVVKELVNRSEEHTSELQSLMRISYAVFCLKIKNYYLYYFFIFLF